MEMNRYDGQRLRQVRQRLNLEPWDVAKMIKEKPYTVQSVELCCNIGPELWKKCAEAMLQAYGYTYEDLQPLLNYHSPDSPGGKPAAMLLTVLKEYFVGYDIYPISAGRVALDFMSFTTQSDMDDLVKFLRLHMPYARIKAYNKNLVLVRPK